LAASSWTVGPAKQAPVAFALRLAPQYFPGSVSLSTPRLISSAEARASAVPLEHAADVSSDRAKTPSPADYNQAADAKPDEHPPEFKSQGLADAELPSSTQLAAGPSSQSTTAPGRLAPPFPASDSDPTSASYPQHFDPGGPETERPQSAPRPFAPKDFVGQGDAPRKDSSLHNQESIGIQTQTSDSQAVLIPAEMLSAVNETMPPISTPTMPWIAAATRSDQSEADSGEARPNKQFRGAPPGESVGTQAKGPPQVLAAQGNSSVRPPMASPREQLSGQSRDARGQDGNDPEAGAKTPKPYLAERPTLNQKGAQARDAAGMSGLFPGQATVAERISSRTEPAPNDSKDSPGSAQVSPEIKTNLSIRPQPLREISVQLADNASNQVDIHIAERAGKVQVAVRTADPELSKSLQTNLGDLVGRLEEKGYKTETWIPSAPLHANAVTTEPSSGSSAGKDQPEQSNSWAGQPQQQQQESGQRRQPRWMTEFEETLDAGDAASKSVTREDL